jgi:hypothetical protein
VLEPKYALQGFESIAKHVRAMAVKRSLAHSRAATHSSESAGIQIRVDSSGTPAQKRDSAVSMPYLHDPPKQGLLQSHRCCGRVRSREQTVRKQACISFPEFFEWNPRVSNFK